LILIKVKWNQFLKRKYST